MAAGKLDLLIEQGATFKHQLQVKQGSGASAPAVNLTSYSARMQIRPEVESTTIYISLTNQNGRITITPLTGTLDLLISATDTAALSFDVAYYDIEIVSAGGEVTRLLQGKVKLSKEVTR
jgi:hypothetical protein